MHSLGNIFLYNNNNINKNLYHSIYEEKGYFLFDTDNLHKFSLYHKEIAPDVMLFDFANKTSLDYITTFEERFSRSDTPIIVVSDTPRSLIYHPSVSHYLNHTQAKTDLNELLEAYCVGNKTHDILYVNLTPYEKSNFASSVEKSKYSIFEVHNLKSALIYLKLNKPKIICINFAPSLTKAKKLFSAYNTFYVENKQNIKEIEQFLA